VTFASTLDSAQNLTITAGTGNVTFTGAVGGTTRLGTLNIVSANNVIASALTLGAFDQDAGSGTTTFGGAVNTNTSAGVVVANTNLAVNAAVTTTSSGVVTFTQSGATVIAAAGDISSDGAVTITSGGGTTISGDVTTTADAIQFASATSLGGDVALASANGAVTFASTLDGTTSDTEDLTIRPGSTGAVTFTGTVGGTTSLGTLSIIRPVVVLASTSTREQVLASQTISQLQVFSDIGGPSNNSELDKAFSSDATTAPFILTGGSATNSVFELSPEIFGGSNNTNDSQENTDERSKR
jgi:hypothetical protein